MRRNRPQIAKVDPKFIRFIEREYPDAKSNAERTRRLLDRLIGKI